MNRLKLLLFPEFTKWEVVEVFTKRNAYYCLQVRSNKYTGMKHFKTICVVDSFHNVRLKNFSIEKINQLTIAG